MLSPRMGHSGGGASTFAFRPSPGTRQLCSCAPTSPPPPTPPCQQHSQVEATMHEYYCTVRRAKARGWANRVHCSVVDQLVHQLCAPNPASIIVVGGGYLGSRATKGCKATPVLQSLLRALAAKRRVVVVDEVLALLFGRVGRREIEADFTGGGRWALGVTPCLPPLAPCSSPLLFPSPPPLLHPPSCAHALAGTAHPLLCNARLMCSHNFEAYTGLFPPPHPALVPGTGSSLRPRPVPGTRSEWCSPPNVALPATSAAAR